MVVVEKIRKVLPGDSVQEKGFKCYGIVENKASIMGTLCKINDLYFIMSKTKIYIPKKYDIVIGRIFYSSQDYYKVDLGSCTGILPALAFQNATKKNKPDLDKEDIVLCQVDRVECGDVLLSCKKSGLGAVNECFPVESWKIRLLYFNRFLQNISQNRTFKIALGMNGFVWIEGDPETKQAVLEAIEKF
ncbi:exosome non-catalytic core subunit rrp40 [Glugoides intestinalis]